MTWACSFLPSESLVNLMNIGYNRSMIIINMYKLCKTCSRTVNFVVALRANKQFFFVYLCSRE